MKRFIKGVGVLKIIQHLQRDHSKLHALLPPPPIKGTMVIVERLPNHLSVTCSSI